MRLGTPSGFRMMSTARPSGRNGMSSCGRMRETTPLLPWRPAILSPAEILRFCALDMRHAQRRVLHLARFFTEDRAQQALLGRQLGLALRRDLADQDVARLDL